MHSSQTCKNHQLPELNRRRTCEESIPPIHQQRIHTCTAYTPAEHTYVYLHYPHTCRAYTPGLPSADRRWVALAQGRGQCGHREVWWWLPHFHQLKACQRRQDPGETLHPLALQGRPWREVAGHKSQQLVPASVHVTVYTWQACAYAWQHRKKSTTEKLNILLYYDMDTQLPYCVSVS